MARMKHQLKFCAKDEQKERLVCSTKVWQEVCQQEKVSPKSDVLGP
ncbi:hypothetical protein MtrunA17_Chr5g0398511 [Medicago truncatula]|uniref:Uncharacterized protein n=1 Tax=Medicago truncatula TaxID=3880 RepID=A0A396HP80_MEDTR|nr:hypothetical protein MtrunA17_Chr5g0398511 [Medicago truncatula]